jgi:hypothetical protein
VKPLAIILVILVVGCGGGGPSYLPFGEEHEWTYQVSSGFQKNVVTVKVGAKTSVGALEGRIFESPLGENRLSWQDSRLLGSQFANSQFNPPIPLLDDKKIPEKSKSREAVFVEVERWKGKIESFGNQRSATAILSQRRDNIQLASGNTNVVETVLDIQIDKTRIEVRTWFERGRGIVRQEQHTNRNLVMSMQLLKSK